jgi:flagella basal body P-ring formation protein FlgA
MKGIKHIAFITYFVLFSLSNAAYADSQSYQSVEQIEQAAYVYSLAEAQAQYDNPHVILEPLDTRLRLQACQSNLIITSEFNHTGLGSQTVTVSCNSPTNWTVYVPIKIKVLKPVVIANKSLDAKHIVQASDVRMEMQNVAEMRQGYVETTSSVIGKQLKYPVSLGMVIRPSAVMQQKVVRRGQQITLVATIGTMEVRMSGTALADGHQGQRVRVKNSSSNRVVEGVVDAPGIVKVIM